MRNQENPQKEDLNSLNSIFEKVAEKFPNRIAVTDGNIELTYKELSHKSSTLAKYLIHKGVKSGELICIYTTRNVNMIIGILGILKAGATYIPIDPKYPSQRIKDIFDISGATFCVSDSKMDLRYISCINILLDCIPESEVNGDKPADLNNEKSLAYVIFTSGSTGKPKGVMVEHKSVIRLFTKTEEIFHFNEHTVWSLFHSIAFDYSVWEIWGALLFGGKLVIVPRKVALNPESFYSLMQKEKISVLSLTPTAFRNFCLAALRKEQRKLEQLEYIVFGGEKLDFEILNPWIKEYGDSKPVLANMYGITEVTVHSTWKIISHADVCNNTKSLIGKPISDLQIEIVDSEGQKVSRGKAGRMFISGDGVARGYLNREELTAERFFTRTGQDGEPIRWFDTGDIAVEISENEFEYIGRNDRQVKISGYRVELEEIEYYLKQFKGVSDCVIVENDQRENGVRLRAFIILDKKENKESILKELRKYAAEKLPKYMCPSTYTVVDKFPMNINGKFSISELQTIQEPKKDNDISGLKTKEIIYNIWSDILGEKEIDEKDSFFYLGGTSFMMIRMMKKIMEIFNIDIGLDDIDEITINSLEAVIERSSDRKKQ